jgi:hypothetical protein
MSRSKEAHRDPKDPPRGERAMIVRAVVGISAALFLAAVYGLVTGQRRPSLTRLLKE